MAKIKIAACVPLCSNAHPLKTLSPFLNKVNKMENDGKRFFTGLIDIGFQEYGREG
jgi:hypothetical protein